MNREFKVSSHELKYLSIYFNKFIKYICMDIDDVNSSTSVSLSFIVNNELLSFKVLWTRLSQVIKSNNQINTLCCLAKFLTKGDLSSFFVPLKSRNNDNSSSRLSLLTQTVDRGVRVHGSEVADMQSSIEGTMLMALLNDRTTK